MDRLFPTLTSAQMGRIATRGRRRPIARGEVLVDVGDHDVPFFVVVSGEIQAVRPTGATEILIVAHGSGTVLWRSHHDHRPPGDGEVARERAR
jgi:thioredoxin reductase (NADPH)